MLRTFGRLSGKGIFNRMRTGILEVDDGQLGLSEPVEAAVPRAIELIKSLINDLLNRTFGMESRDCLNQAEGGESNASIEHNARLLYWSRFLRPR